MRKFLRGTAMKVGVACLAMSMLAGCSAAESASTAGGDSATWKPEHDITIRVPAAAGGVFDLATRIFAQCIQTEFGTTAMVTNLTGANGGVASADMMQYDATPCEMMGGNIGMFTMTPLFSPDIALNLEDYAIVASLISDEFVLCVAPGNKGIESWEDLVEYGKTNKILVGSQAPGDTGHALVTAMFSQAGFDFDIVTADGSNKNMIATVAGDTDCCIVSAPVAQQFITEGTVTPIVCFSDTPTTIFEGLEVPTAQSFGYDYVFRTNNFIMTRADADPAGIQAMYDAYYAYSQTDEFKALAAESNLVPYIYDGATTKASLTESAEMFKEIYEAYYK